MPHYIKYKQEISSPEKKLLFIFEKRNVSQEICDNALNSVSRVRRGT